MHVAATHKSAASDKNVVCYFQERASITRTCDDTPQGKAQCVWSGS